MKSGVVRRRNTVRWRGVSWCDRLFASWLKENDPRDDGRTGRKDQLHQQRDLSTLWAKQALGRLTEFDHDDTRIADPADAGGAFESSASIFRAVQFETDRVSKSLR